jgi:hypothetical protein
MIDNLKDRIKDKEYKDLVEKIAELNKEEEKEEFYVCLKILKITESKQIVKGCRVGDDDEWECDATTLFESNNYEHLVMNFKIVDNGNDDDRIFSLNMIERGYDISKAQYEKLKKDIRMNGCQVLRKWSNHQHNNEYRMDWGNDEQYSYFNTTYIITDIVELDEEI